jgi:uncharacterized protein YdeI (BOF family)
MKVALSGGLIMNRTSSLALAAALCFLLWSFCGGPATSFALISSRLAVQQPTNSSQADISNQSQQQMVMMTGTIVQQNGQFVLQDSGKTYKLDVGGDAKKYENKKVRVMGMLDTASNTIHVTKIKPAA